MIFNILEIEGRKIRIATGQKSQTINICDENNKLGNYEQIYRISLNNRFLKEEDINYIKKLGSIEELVVLQCRKR